MLINCTICMSNITSSESADSTPCGHVFHVSCLEQWLLRARTCPQCRSLCADRNIRRLFFTASLNSSNAADTETMQMELDDARLELRNLKKDIVLLEARAENLQTSQKQSKDTIRSLESLHQLERRKNREAAAEIDRLKQEYKLMCILEKDLKEKTEQLEDMSYIKSVIDSTACEVETMLKEGRTPKSLATLVVSMKREVATAERKKNETRNHLRVCQNEILKLKAKEREYNEKISTLESDYHKMKDDLFQLQHTLNEPKNNENKPSTSSLLTAGTPTLSPVCNSSSTTMSSNSPYLNIKQSSVGLSPLLKRKLVKPKADGSMIADGAKNSQYQNLSIFHNPRKILKLGSNLKNQSLVYNGIGGTERKENFIGFPQAQSKNP